MGKIEQRGCRGAGAAHHGLTGEQAGLRVVAIVFCYLIRSAGADTKRSRLASRVVNNVRGVDRAVHCQAGQTARICRDQIPQGIVNVFSDKSASRHRTIARRNIRDDYLYVIAAGFARIVYDDALYRNSYVRADL